MTKFLSTTSIFKNIINYRKTSEVDKLEGDMRVLHEPSFSHFYNPYDLMIGILRKVFSNGGDEDFEFLTSYIEKDTYKEETCVSLRYLKEEADRQMYSMPDAIGRLFTSYYKIGDENRIYSLNRGIDDFIKSYKFTKDIPRKVHYTFFQYYREKDTITFEYNTEDKELTIRIECIKSLFGYTVPRSTKEKIFTEEFHYTVNRLHNWLTSGNKTYKILDMEMDDKTKYACANFSVKYEDIDRDRFEYFTRRNRTIFYNTSIYMEKKETSLAIPFFVDYEMRNPEDVDIDTSEGENKCVLFKQNDTGYGELYVYIEKEEYDEASRTGIFEFKVIGILEI